MYAPARYIIYTKHFTLLQRKDLTLVSDGRFREKNWFQAGAVRT